MSATKPLIEGSVFSHGTMDSRNAKKTQRFLQEFLGVHSVRKSKGTQYVWLGGKWFIACLDVGDKIPPRQGDGFRFGLLVETPEEVDAAHVAALEQQEKWEIRKIGPVQVAGDTRAFCLQDLDGNWWEIYYRLGHLYDDLFEREAAHA
ncbi:MAG: VOC family protein [Pseudomonadota bacterium]|nr:VOC family protein [Pseudomonadota bacterium]